MSTIPYIFIDYISFTLKVRSPDVRSAILAAFFLYKDFLDNPKGHIHRSNPRYHHKLEVDLPVDGNPSDTVLLTIGIQPLDPKHNFVWVAFNPAGRDTGVDRAVKAVIAVRKVLTTVLAVEHAKRIFNHATVTRIDCTVDIHNVKPDDFLLTVSKMKKTTIITGTDGMVETIQHGKTGGDSMCVVVYSKDRERKAKNKPILPEDHFLTRFEFRLKPRIPIARLHTASCPIDRVRVFHKDIKDVEMDEFLDACRYRGITAALKRRDFNERRVLLRWLKQHKIDLINANEIWKGWAKALSVFDPLIPPNRK